MRGIGKEEEEIQSQLSPMAATTEISEVPSLMRYFREKQRQQARSKLYNIVECPKLEVTAGDSCGDINDQPSPSLRRRSTSCHR